MIDLLTHSPSGLWWYGDPYQWDLKEFTHSRDGYRFSVLLGVRPWTLLPYETPTSIILLVGVTTCIQQ